MNPKPPGARGELPSALTHLPYQAGPAKLCLVQPAPQLGGPRSLLPSPHPPPLSPHTGCPEDPGGVDGGGQRTGASPSECESRPAGRAGLRWRSSGTAGRKGKWNLLHGAQLLWSSFSGLSQETLKRVTLTERPGIFHLLFTPLSEDCGLLKPTCAGEFCKLPMALSPVGNYTGHLTSQPAYQVTGAKKIAGLGWGNPG